PGVRNLLRALPRASRRRRRVHHPSGLPPSPELLLRESSRRARQSLLRGHHARLRDHVSLRRSGRTRRSLGYRRLHPRAPAGGTRTALGRPAGGAAAPRVGASRQGCACRIRRPAVSAPRPLHDDLPLLTRLGRRRWIALVIGVAGLVACGLDAPSHPSEVIQSYFIAWLYFLGLTIGSMTTLMIYHLTGGDWGQPVRRWLEAALAPMLLLAVLFVPVGLGLPHLFTWAIAGTELTRLDGNSQQWFLDPTFFLLRAGLYLAVWLLLSRLVVRGMRHGRPLTAVCAAGLLAYTVTAMFASVDWIDSLMPLWYSTVVGLIFMTSQNLGAFALAVLCATAIHLSHTRSPGGLATDSPQAPPDLTPDRCIDLGTLLFVYVLTWAYVAFSQWIIVWGGDLPHETAWYLPRWHSSWRWVTYTIECAQFGLPFILLLFRALKRDARAMLLIAALVLCVHWLYVAWLVKPSLASAGVSLAWTDCAATFGVGGLWA